MERKSESISNKSSKLLRVRKLRVQNVEPESFYCGNIGTTLVGCISEACRSFDFPFQATRNTVIEFLSRTRKNAIVFGTPAKLSYADSERIDRS